MSGTAQIVFDPHLGWAVLGVLGLAAVLITALSVWRGLSGWWLRGLGLLAVLAALANPALRSEERTPLNDVALLVVDETGSNRLGARTAQTDAAREHLLRRLDGLGIEARETLVPDDADNRGTRLMDALNTALADLPRDRLAGVFVISDGIVHDTGAAPADLPAPLHLLQTGEPGDWDRRLIIRNAPAYGILGEVLSMTLRIEDQGAVPAELRGQPVRVGFSVNGEEMRYATAPTGRDMDLAITLDRGGVNVLHFVLDPAPGELTTRNNEAVVQINGIRDRLRVLLVSGEPHSGQRTWRNLLKSDPSVDLVHFTILRPPDRQDGVPVNELSLIAFPTRELFIEKIDEFDLIIFDRYRRRGILPNSYFENIRRYVEDGGALLVVGGRELASADSIYYSPLGRIFPAEPTARVFEEPFVPRPSDLGTRHPVTAGLADSYPLRADGSPGWGRWLRQIDMVVRRGDVVMEGLDGRPLLVLDRVGEGRVALMASDQAWLWDRGFEGGGPQAELLRRLAHWMMGEPDLEEEALDASAQGAQLRVTRQSLQPGPHRVTLRGPDGSELEVTLPQVAPGRFATTLEGLEQGLYRLSDGALDSVLVLGPGNPREYETTIATATDLGPLMAATQGGVAVLAQGQPDLRRVAAGRQAHGRGWLGVTPRDAYLTTDLRLAALLPPWAWLLLGAGLILAGWLREARR
ncbi:MAG: hypothetical protein ACK4LQ_12240 [Pararhodobacter sp.]